MIVDAVLVENLFILVNSSLCVCMCVCPSKYAGGGGGNIYNCTENPMLKEQ